MIRSVVPTVGDYMSVTTETVAPDTAIDEALAMMRRTGHRHLPVRRLGEVLGIVSERDLLAAKGERQAGERCLVIDAMTPFPCEVAPDTPVAEAAATMAKGKFGAVLVMRNARLVGLFTTTDALRALADLAGVVATLAPEEERRPS